MSENFVELEHKQCPVCLKIHSHNAGLLISKNLKPIKKENTITGWGLCKEHQELADQGYVALIGVLNAPTNGNTMQQEDAQRSGTIAHMRWDAFKSVINAELGTFQPVIFVEQTMIDMLKKGKENEQPT